MNPFSFDKLPCDPSKDFKPISLRAEVLRLNVAQPDLLSAACAKAVHEPASVERLMADEALPVGGMAAEFAQVKPDGRAEPSTATPRPSAAPAATQSPQAAMLAR